MDQDNRPRRGLGALLVSTTQASAPGQGAQAPKPLSFSQVHLNTIRPNPNQPRTHFDEAALIELSRSIKARGLVQPLVVRTLKPNERSGDVAYELIAGERRWRASQLAGLTSVEVVIKEVYDPRDILLLSLVENLQRDDLNPIDEAQAYDKLGKDFDLTHDQIADGVGKNRATISNAVRLLELPTSVQEAIKIGKLTTGHAKLLLTIPDPKLQAQLAAKAQAENMTVRDLERLISVSKAPDRGVPVKTPREKGTRNTRVSPSHLQEAERRLREYFGTRVNIDESLRKGRIIIEFYSVEDFERITSLMHLDT